MFATKLHITQRVSARNNTNSQRTVTHIFLSSHLKDQHQDTKFTLINTVVVLTRQVKIPTIIFTRDNTRQLKREAHAIPWKTHTHTKICIHTESVLTDWTPVEHLNEVFRSFVRRCSMIWPHQGRIHTLRVSHALQPCQASAKALSKPATINAAQWQRN